MNFAPVIVFNYNRPDHSLRTWEALAKNQFAADTELYLYCDGPKTDASDEMRQRIMALHEQAKQYSRDAVNDGKFKSVHVVCAKRNKGLANSIIGGVTEVINKHGRVIVLEDDLLTSPYFLKYMNTALDKYESYPAVFSIGAYNFPPQKMAIPKDYKYDVYVSLRFNSWGWAMWKDRWDKIDWSLDYLEDYLKHPEQIKAFNRGGDDLTEMLLMQRDGKIDSWAIRCAYNQFANHSMTILPCISYIDNIGLDGTGSHCANTLNIDKYNDIKLSSANPIFLDVLYEDKRIINAFYNCYCRSRRPLWQKAINYMFRKIRKPAPFEYKKKVYV